MLVLIQDQNFKLTLQNHGSSYVLKGCIDKEKAFMN